MAAWRGARNGGASAAPSSPLPPVHGGGAAQSRGGLRRGASGAGVSVLGARLGGRSTGGIGWAPAGSS